MKFVARRIVIPLASMLLIGIAVSLVAEFSLSQFGGNLRFERLVPLAFEHSFEEVAEGASIPLNDPLFLLYSAIWALLVVGAPAYIATLGLSKNRQWLVCLPIAVIAFAPSIWHFIVLLLLGQSVAPVAFLVVSVPFIFSAASLFFGAYIANRHVKRANGG